MENLVETGHAFRIEHNANFYYVQHITDASPRGVKRPLKSLDEEKSESKDGGDIDDQGTFSSIPAKSIEHDKLRSFDASSWASDSIAKKEDAIALQQQALRLHQMLWDIFTNRFETHAGIWIGSACCPFKSTYTVCWTLKILLFTLIEKLGAHKTNIKTSLNSN